MLSNPKVIILILFTVWIAWLLFSSTLPGTSWQGYTVDHSKISQKDRWISLSFFCLGFFLFLEKAPHFALLAFAIGFSWLILNKKH